MKDLLTTIQVAKTACPELRVGQLLINALSYTDRKNLFFISDEELTKALQSFVDAQEAINKLQSDS
jgi:hypothetical protein